MGFFLYLNNLNIYFLEVVGYNYKWVATYMEYINGIYSDIRK